MKNIWKKEIKSFTVGWFFFTVSWMLLFAGRNQSYGWQEKKIDVRNDNEVQKQKNIPVVSMKNTKEQKKEMNTVEVSSPVSIRILLKDSTYQKDTHDHVIVSSLTGLQNENQVLSQPEEVIDLQNILKVGETMVLEPVDDGEKKGEIRIHSLKRAQGEPSYEGKLEVQRKEEGFILINEVDLETYLKYVVPSEMPASYPLEALKAQAVCARTYGVKQMKENRIAKYDADVDDSVSFQVYNNLSRNPSSDQAVEETANQILVYQGNPITAYFFSTSCGHTATEEVWGNQERVPYLKSSEVSDGEQGDYEKQEPWYRWNVTFPIDKIQKKVDEQFPEIGKIKGLDVKKRSSGENVILLEISGENGSVNLENEYKIREFFSPEGLSVECQDGSVHKEMQLLPSSCIQIDPEISQNQLIGFKISGGGYGHGVGMSQNGAKCMAGAGKTMEEIIHAFFQDIEFSTCVE